MKYKQNDGDNYFNDHDDNEDDNNYADDDDNVYENDKDNKDSKPGLKINKKVQSQLRDKIQKLSCTFAEFSRKIITLHCVVSGFAKQNMSPQYSIQFNSIQFSLFPLDVVT